MIDILVVLFIARKQLARRLKGRARRLSTASQPGAVARGLIGLCSHISFVQCHFALLEWPTRWRLF